MPRLLEFFNRCRTCITSNLIPASAIHTNTQVTNSIVQIITTSVESTTLSVILSGTVAQSLASLYAIFHYDTFLSEKLLHLFQGLVAATRFCLAVLLLFEKETCEVLPPSSPICNALFLLKWIYSATISLGLAASALSKASVSQDSVLQASLSTPVSTVENTQRELITTNLV